MVPEWANIFGFTTKLYSNCFLIVNLLLLICRPFKVLRPRRVEKIALSGPKVADCLRTTQPPIQSLTIGTELVVLVVYTVIIAVGKVLLSCDHLHVFVRT
jgi:hypothetical protein